MARKNWQISSQSTSDVLKTEFMILSLFGETFEGRLQVYRGYFLLGQERVLSLAKIVTKMKKLRHKW